MCEEGLAALQFRPDQALDEPRHDAGGWSDGAEQKSPHELGVTRSLRSLSATVLSLVDRGPKQEALEFPEPRHIPNKHEGGHSRAPSGSRCGKTARLCAARRGSRGLGEAPGRVREDGRAACGKAAGDVLCQTGLALWCCVATARVGRGGAAGDEGCPHRGGEGGRDVRAGGGYLAEATAS